MRNRVIPLAPLAVLGLALVPGTPVSAGAADVERCDATVLAAKLHERLKTEGRSDGDIRDLLDSGMKRRMMRSRVAEQTGCTSDQAESALRELEVATKN